jgi:SAM-dependent methyltransferase
LARYYDLFFTPQRSWGVKVRERLLKQILPKVSSACDLACGTGSTAVELAGQCVKVFAVDRSPAMCELTRKKARRAGLPVQVIQADMRTFRLPEQVDLVTCEFDAINHLQAKAHLARVVESGAKALRPGGYFYFDVNNLVAFEKGWQKRWWAEKPGVVLMMSGGYDVAREKAFADVEWFIRSGRSWRRFREHIEEVCWSATEVRAALREAGFGSVKAWDAAPLFPEDPDIRRGFRTFYLARKSG